MSPHEQWVQSENLFHFALFSEKTTPKIKCIHLQKTNESLQMLSIKKKESQLM